MNATAVIVKALSREPMPRSWWILAAVNAGFAVAFASLLWRDPIPRR